MSAFTRTMRFVGDLDDDFYHDERQRDVWNEASAVGFQLFYWVGLIVAAILPWVAGRAGAWVAVGIVVVSTAISYLTLAYSGVRGVNLYTAAKLLRLRGGVATVFVLIAFIGIFSRLRPSMYHELGTSVGALVGAAVGGGVAWLIIRYVRGRNDRFENEEF